MGETVTAVQGAGAPSTLEPGVLAAIGALMGQKEARGHLYYGDNLDVLPLHITDASVDLVYLDPPFNSKATYNVLFTEQDGSRSPAQIRAFEDTWHWDQSSLAAYTAVVEGGGVPGNALAALYELLGGTNMMAYLAMMAPRLIELRRVMKDGASIYLHCDPTASHYLKVVMDAVFGARGFQNEIIWHYRGGGVSKTRWGRRHDVLLFYTKGPKPKTFNVDEVREPYSEASAERLRYKARSFRGEKTYDTYEPHPKGKHPDDVWDMQPIMPSAKEQLPYPTQKPERLLERVIKASSNEGDVVLDPFCGCGTTVVVAHRLKRRWLGIDITHLAVGLMKHRLRDTFGDEVINEYAVTGEPTTLEGAHELAREDPFQFQVWALGQADARQADVKRGADRGIDGQLLFVDDSTHKAKQVVFSVKAGKTGPDHVRELHGVVDRENAAIGVLITMKQPTRQMRQAAAEAGFYESPGWGTKYPRVQLLTIEDLLEGKRVDMPPIQQVSRTFKKAPRAKPDQGTAASLFDEVEADVDEEPPF